MTFERSHEGAIGPPELGGLVLTRSDNKSTIRGIGCGTQKLSMPLQRPDAGTTASPYLSSFVFACRHDPGAVWRIGCMHNTGAMPGQRHQRCPLRGRPYSGRLILTRSKDTRAV